ncbi:MAG: thiamine pyrophosphate-dependent enzyme, partial [Bacteroidota bacterium]
MDKYSYIANAHGSYIDELYNNYKQDPSSVDISWQKFFEGFDFSQVKYGENGGVGVSELSSKDTQVRNLIHAYRSRGHLKSDTNPVRQRRDHNVKLDPSEFGLQTADLETAFAVGNEVGLGNAKLKDIVAALNKIYLGPIGYEYMHIRDAEVLDWFKKKCEKDGLNINPPIDTKKRILEKLNEAVVFENFLHTKFLGQKRFSLEGGENTIPALDAIINEAGNSGVKEVVIGMAHRGRLNVLANIMGKTYDEVFNEFEGNTDPDLTMGDGDVKYHLGYSSRIKTSKEQNVYIKLTPNPSHLEAVDPLVLGYTRGQIDDEYSGDLKKAMSVLIHGDAAVA